MDYWAWVGIVEGWAHLKKVHIWSHFLEDLPILFPGSSLCFLLTMRRVACAAVLSSMTFSIFADSKD